MPVTEVTLCRLSPGATIDDPELRSKLAHAKRVKQKYTGKRFYLFQDNNDPSNLFVIGEWDSVDQHMNHFIPRPENQEIVKSLEDLMTVEWMLHVDAPHADLPLPKTDAEREKAIREGFMMTIIRNFVVHEKIEKFQRVSDYNIHVLKDIVTEGAPASGWRIDKWLGKDECLWFLPWINQAQHDQYRCPENTAKMTLFEECINGIELKRVTILDI